MPPARAELPTTRQLLRSTIIAIFAAAAILVTIVLPQGSQPLPIDGKTRAANAVGEAQIVGRNANCAAFRAGICRHPANVEHGIAESRRVSSRRRIVADSAMRHGIVVR